MAKPFTVPPICRNCLNKEKCPADCSMRSLSGNENKFTLPNPGCHSVTAVDPVECFMKLARWNVWDYVRVECHRGPQKKIHRYGLKGVVWP